MKENGFFITVEGIEGAGKSTVSDYLEKSLVARLGQEKVLRFREPGGTEIAEEIRKTLINDQYSEQMHAKTELLLMVAARNQLIENKIKPALNQGLWVIGDRHAFSSYAYQGIGRKLGVDLVRKLHQLCFSDFKPDLTFYLDVSAEVGFERIKCRGAKDRIEQESLTFFKAIRQGYLELLDEMNAVKIDAEQSLNDIYAELDKELDKVHVDTVSV
jgi:dTMP kinase